MATMEMNSSGQTKQRAHEAGFVSATNHGQVSDNHQCCYDSQTRVSSSCASSRLNDLQEKTAGPRLGDNVAVVRDRVSALALITQPVNHSPIAEECPSG